ncbi:hypothetical protein CPT_Moonbeam196 [Bacillus phage Moonbeam]|uniref:Uncharacterized protein n=1 Tax=Bacillus phage Moonbeam TaxID=1540091 RepID=A0A0A0RPP8_9CAUD|nr:hypothetical protein CPT_Moonbeam196 [Bacillus phage Moonbeam]AIW03594.1 hypothetical protein CPT_Moonbeam196 [Bacillus phage Moonbeam]
MKLYVLSEREIIDCEGEYSFVVGVFGSFKKAQDYAASQGYTEYIEEGYYGDDSEFIPTKDKRYTRDYDGKSYVLDVAKLDRPLYDDGIIDMKEYEPKEVTSYLNGEKIAKAKTIPGDTTRFNPVGTVTSGLDSSKENKSAKPKSNINFPKDQEEK